MNRPEDFKRLGLNPDVVELWEDGRRRDPGPGLMENWYFDSIMEDGTKAVVVFLTSSSEKRHLAEDYPNLRIQITDPSGQHHESFIEVPAADCEIRKGECLVQMGPHSFIGDLVDYRIKVEPVNGIGCDLHLQVLVKPFRPGTGYVAFGDDEAKEYTWICFPRGRVTGSLTYAGKTHDVTGMGYHDHQFHNVDSMTTIHHWLWGRQSLDDYTVVIFDIVANEKYGFKRVPIFGLIDNTSGEAVFQNTDHAVCSIKEMYLEHETQKPHPKLLTYTYEHSGKKIDYMIRWKQEIEVRSSKNIFDVVDEETKKRFDQMNLDPSYIRYVAEAELVITEHDEIKRARGDMIYEFAYFGKPDKRAHIELDEG